MEILKTYSIISDTLNGDLNPKKLQNEIEVANCVVNLKSIDIAGDTFTIIGASITDETLLNNTVAIHEAISLDEYKSQRYVEIDAKTGELISQGFTYQNLIFSLSQNAQINLLGLDNTRDDPSMTYPIAYNTLDDLNSYDVQSANDIHLMYLTALGTKKSYVDSGTILKKLIRDAVDYNAVELIIDNR